MSESLELNFPFDVMKLHLFIINEFVCWTDFFQFSNNWSSGIPKVHMEEWLVIQGEVYGSAR